MNRLTGMDEWTRQERQYFEALTPERIREMEGEHIWHYPNSWLLFRRIVEYQRRFPDRRLKILDIGCGPAISPRRFFAKHRLRPIYFGLDVSLGLLRYAARRFPEGGFVQCDLNSLPVRGARFDFILSLGVLHHLPDVSGALGRFAELLVPGGEALLQEPNHLAARFWSGASPRERALSAQDVRKAAAGAGLRLVSLKNVNSPAFLFLRGWVKRLGGGAVLRPRAFWWTKTRLEMLWDAIGAPLVWLQGMNSFYVFVRCP